MLRTSAAYAACLALTLGATSALAADLPPDLAKAVHDYDQAQFSNDVATLDRFVADEAIERR
ncbi:MAG TPA: hypothetical protein VK629_19360, partial [Steroidobacteraceae bacterium]|nr:hypothetical protein [Steroidobacteraceae bacterium]